MPRMIICIYSINTLEEWVGILLICLVGMLINKIPRFCLIRLHETNVCSDLSSMSSPHTSQHLSFKYPHFAAKDGHLEAKTN